MNDKWEGFTQEEIFNISNQKIPYRSNKDVSTNGSPVKKITFKQKTPGKKNMTRERMLMSHKDHLSTMEKPSELPQEARLFTLQVPEKEEVETSSVDEKPAEKSSDTSSSEVKTSEDIGIKNTNLPSVLLQTHNSSEADLENFEKRQKMIKEQNRQRKALLKQALEDRTKRTHEEARRLSQIEDELKKLDLQLSNDVSILRNQIEVASLEFMEAQKRFDRAEQEYLDAKMILFTKQERKELLTAHLCTIIEQNELRKAKKLSDLMDKLQLGSVIIEKPMVLEERKTDPTKSSSNDENPDDNVTPALTTVS